MSNHIESIDSYYVFMIEQHETGSNLQPTWQTNQNLINSIQVKSCSYLVVYLEQRKKILEMKLVDFELQGSILIVQRTTVLGFARIRSNVQEI